MTRPTLLAIDQGTTSTRAVLFGLDGQQIAIQQKQLSMSYPKHGWVEQRPQDIWNDTLDVCRNLIKNHSDWSHSIVAIGITNQRETTVLWDRHSGKPVYNAIVWQDRRTAKHCDRLKAAGYEDIIRNKTGLLLDPYFSATKIAWLLENIPNLRKQAEAGEIAFGTVDSFLLWNLTGGRVHATDATNASRTLLFNIQTQTWDTELLEIFNIPKVILPEVKDNVASFGITDKSLFGRAIPIGGMAGDQQAALIGQACFQPGMLKTTYGTGCFALMNIGDRFQASSHHLLTSLAYRFDDQIAYVLEGSIFVAGAAVQWLRDGLHLFDDAADSEVLATSVTDNGGVYLVPAFTGLGAPYWRPEARAIIMGLGRESTAAHITRAALEAQAYQTLDLITAMANDSGIRPKVLRADGGLVKNQFVCQFLADMLNLEIEIPVNIETTALGAAYLAGLSAGLYNDLEDISKAWQLAHLYRATIAENDRNRLYQGWQKAIQMLLGEKSVSS